MEFDAEALQKQIPYYLTAKPDQKSLLENLKGLIEGSSKSYYLGPASDPYVNTILQGDGWRGFQVLSFSTGSRTSVRGIVLSNSCDVSPENERVLPPRVTFTPIVKLQRIKARFEERGLQAEQITTRIEAIRTQKVTNLFYLPAGNSLDEEHVAILDDLHSMPVQVQQEDGEKLFTLNMAGFYLFVFKLSVHFCRLHENVDRRPQD